MLHRTLALSLLLAAPLLADDVAAYLKKLDEKYYSPEVAGLKDFSVAASSSSWAQEGWKEAKVRLYWKAPNRKRVRIEGAPEEMKSKVAEEEKGLVSLVDEVLTDPWAKQASDNALTLTEEGGKKVLAGVPNKGSEAAEEVASWKAVFDKDDLLLQLEVTAKDEAGTKALMEFTWIEKDGKRLVESRTGHRVDPSTGEPAGAAVSRFEYDKVGGFWLLVKMTSEAEEKETWTLTDYKVNAGIEDSVFEK